MAKRGRQPNPLKRKRHLSLRLDPILLDRLVAAQRQAGTASLSEEIEARLVASFGEAERIADQFGSFTTYHLFRTIARQIGNIEHLAGVRRVHDPAHMDVTPRRWWENRYVFDEMKLLTNEIIDRFKPSGSAKPPREVRGVRVRLGRYFALRAMAELEVMTHKAALEGFPARSAGDLVGPPPHASEIYEASLLLKRKLRRSALKDFTKLMESKP